MFYLIVWKQAKSLNAQMEWFTPVFEWVKKKMQQGSIVFFVMVFASIVWWIRHFLTIISIMNCWAIGVISYIYFLKLLFTLNLGHTIQGKNLLADRVSQAYCTIP